jgi:hypothetical protein
VIGGMWRWAWTAGVFGLFFLVVGAALENAPRADGELPLIEPDAAPIKERVALPDLDAVVPRSSVLNLLAEEDDPEADVPDALAALHEGLEERAARAREVERVEAAAAGDGGGEAAPSAAPEAAAESPFETVPRPDRRPATTATATPEAGGAGGDGGAAGREVAARTTGEAYRIQLAAVPPGEEQATFDRLEQRYGDALAGLTPRFRAVSTDSGVLVRVQAAGFASEAAATAQCERIRAAGGDCFVVAGSG